LKIYLAGFESYKETFFEVKPKYVLGSFYYVSDRFANYIKQDFCTDYLLDSGAFTFMENKNKKTDWGKYVEKYAEYINKHNINNFFELDIDSVVGYKKVVELREKLENLTTKKVIPVWHKSRGKKEFQRLTKLYDRISLGGIVSGEFRRSDFKYFKWFIRQAHDNNCEIHALGLTGIEPLLKYNFDSVDSTTWNRAKFGEMCYFDGGRIQYVQQKNKRLSDNRKANKKNLAEWVKFQRYADRNMIRVYAKTTLKKLRELLIDVKKIFFLDNYTRNKSCCS